MTGNMLPDWLPDLGGTISSGELLRRWTLSEVWRIRLNDAGQNSVIVKRGAGEEADEVERYRDLVIPLSLPAPRLLARGAPGVFVLEDLGGDNLEDRPMAEGFDQAVRVLAQMRAASARRLASNSDLGVGLRRSTADFLALGARAGAALAALRPDLAGALDEPVQALHDRLGQWSGAPEAVVHGDFQAKNLLYLSSGRIVPIDWSHAYVHPHLGDLYLLIREGLKQGRVDSSRLRALPQLFAREAGIDLATVNQQLITGGLCWTLDALRWVVESGVPHVHVPLEWIDELMTDLRELTGRHLLAQE